MKSRVRTALAGMLLLLASACGDGGGGVAPTGSAVRPGTYVLASVNGAGAPFTVEDVLASARAADGTADRHLTWITADTIVITTGAAVSRSWRRDFELRFATPSNGQSGVAGSTTVRYTGTYVQRGDTLLVMHDGNYAPFPAPVDTVLLEGGALRRDEAGRICDQFPSALCPDTPLRLRYTSR